MNSTTKNSAASQSANPRGKFKHRWCNCLLILVLCLFVLTAAAVGTLIFLLKQHQIAIHGLSYQWSAQRIHIDSLLIGPDKCSTIDASAISISVSATKSIILNTENIQLNPACLLPSSSATKPPTSLAIPDLGRDLQIKIKCLEITNIATLKNLSGQIAKEEISLSSEVKHSAHIPYAQYLPKSALLNINWHQADEKLSIELNQEQGLNVSISGSLQANGDMTAKGLIHGQQGVNGEFINLYIPVSIEYNQQLQKIALQQAKLQYKHHLLQLDSQLENQLDLLSSTIRFSLQSSPNSKAQYQELAPKSSLTGELTLAMTAGNTLLGQWQLASHHYPLSQLIDNLPNALANVELNSHLHGAISGTIDGTLKELILTSEQASKLSLINSAWDPKIGVSPNIKLKLNKADTRGYKLSLTGKVGLQHSHGNSQFKPSLSINSHSQLISGNIYGESHITPLIKGEQQSIKMVHQFNLQGPITNPSIKLKQATARIDLNWQQTVTAQSTLALTNPVTVWPIKQQTTFNAEGNVDHIYWKKRALPSSKISLNWEPQQSVSAILNWQPGVIKIAAIPKSLTGTVDISALPLSLFSAFLPPDVTLNSGIADGHAQLAVMKQSEEKWLQIEGDTALSQLTGIINDIAFINAASKIKFNGVNKTLSINGDLNIEQVNPGFAISNINSLFQAHLQNDLFNIQLSNLSANLFGGRLSSAQLIYPSTALAEVKLHNIQLEQLSQLQTEPVVTLTGAIDANLPLNLNQEGISISNGKAVNRGLAKMEIVDKTVLEQYIQANPALAFAIRPLEQLDIHQLTAKVDLETNGEMLLNAKIQGENAQQPHRLHLNYKHQENMIDLLTSIRLSDSFQKQIEKALENKKE